MKKFTLLAVLISILALATGCGAKPEASVTSYFDALAKGDFATADTYVNGETKFDGDIQEQLSKMITSKLSAKVLESKTDGDKATVTTEITATDMKTLVPAMFQEILPQIFALAFSGADDVDKQTNDLMMGYFTKEFAKPDVKTVTTKVDIELTYDKEKKLWIITRTDELGDAMTGGMVTAFNEMAQNMGGQD